MENMWYLGVDSSQKKRQYFRSFGYEIKLDRLPNEFEKSGYVKPFNVLLIDLSYLDYLI